MRTYSTIEKVLNSAVGNFKSVFAHLDTPLLITGIFVVIVVISYLIKSKGAIKQIDIKRLLKQSVFVLYISFVLEITLLQRIGKEQNPPFSEIWTSWSIFSTDKLMYVDFTPIVNIVMMMPIAFILYFIFNQRNKTIQRSALGAFVLSAIIEASQVVFHLGTLQVSDLTYNTLGGVVGALLLISIKKIYKKIKEKKV